MAGNLTCVCECDIRPETVPEAVLDDLARTLIDSIRAYYADPAHEQEYQAWLAERRRNAGEG